MRGEDTFRCCIFRLLLWETQRLRPGDVEIAGENPLLIEAFMVSYFLLGGGPAGAEERDCLDVPQAVHGRVRPGCRTGQRVPPRPPIATCPVEPGDPTLTDQPCVCSGRWSRKWGNGERAQPLGSPPRNGQQSVDIQFHLRPGCQPWDDFSEFSRAERKEKRQLMASCLLIRISGFMSIEARSRSADKKDRTHSAHY